MKSLKRLKLKAPLWQPFLRNLGFGFWEWGQKSRPKPKEILISDLVGFRV